MAGGSGQRFGARKQFLPLAGSPVAAWAVRAARASNDGVVLVVPAAADPSADGPSAGLPVPGTGPDDAWGADAVVAGGAWSRALLDPLGIHLKLETQRGYHVQFSGSGQAVSRTVVLAECCCRRRLSSCIICAASSSLTGKA